MSFVATLIAGPSVSAGQLEAASAAAVAALEALGADSNRPDLLSPGRAIDLPFDGVDPDQAEAAIRTAIGTVALDIIAQSTDERRKRLLLADMESTIIGQEMLDELADLRGIRAEIAGITHRAMNGELDFRAALAERVLLLAGLPASSLSDMEARITINEGAAALVATMRKSGARALLVSGGFTCFTDRVQEWLGFDEVHANVLELADAALTGRVLEPVRDKDDKRRVLIETAAALRVPLSATAAVGDGANDVPMLQAAGLGVAYRAKPSVRDVVRARLDHAGLDGILYAQGYREDEIVRPQIAR